jgi:hypothetical protein
MKPRIQGYAALALACASGCAVSSESPAAPASSESAQSESPPIAAEEAAREAERVLADRRAPGGAETSTEGEVGGFVQILDDQLSNNHTVFATFYKKRTAQNCGDFTPLEGGGECFTYRPCNPPAPPFMQPEPTTVGKVEVTSAFDTIRLEPIGATTFYPRTVRPGPFWRGDGDEVTFSFTGVPGAVPAFTYRERAPVGDVIAKVPTPFAREAPIRLTWSYADGSQAAVGDMSIRLFQRDSAASVACRAPLAARAIELPRTLLTRFTAGPANLILQSVAVGTGFTPLEQGSVRLTFQLASVVDTGEVVDPAEPNVSFL